MNEHQLNFEGGNETDVREELAAPLISALGYQRGTNNDVGREVTLRRPYESLGRKKSDDPVLRGRADYVLFVTGFARWVLETKPPTADISIDDIEQAMSYARHPEISGCYVAVTNGRRFLLMQAMQKPDDPPLFDIEVRSLKQLVLQLESTLSPAAIRRDFAPRVVDTIAPIADGLRSQADIMRGWIVSREISIHVNFPLPKQHQAEFSSMISLLKDRRSTITSGRIWRDEDSRIRAQLTWDAPHEQILQFMRDKNMETIQFVSLSDEPRLSENHPTVFDMAIEVEIQKGEPLFDIRRWETTQAGVPVQMSVRGQGEGTLKDNVFAGFYRTHYEAAYPNIPFLQMVIEISGEFSVEIDPR